MNVLNLHNVIAGVCPIHGIDSNNNISFKDEATDDQKALAVAMAVNWEQRQDLYSEYYKWDSEVGAWVIDTSKKQEALAELIERINTHTAVTIYNGIEYGGVQFYLTAENQRNYSELDRCRDELTYPQLVWCGPGEVTLADADAVHTFYMTGQNFIQTTLNAGRVQKNAAREMTTAEIIAALEEL